MHKNKKSAALIFLSIILSGAVLLGIGYILYLKWLSEGNEFLFARDYSGVALTSVATVALIFEVLFITVTVIDRKAFNHINEENAVIQAKYKKVCIRLKNSEKDVDNLKAVQSVLLQNKSSDVECGKEQWEKALDKYLDDAYLSGIPQVRIVHGKGTGALRNGVAAYLKGISYVKSFRLGEQGEGDAGVTIVEFK